MNCIKKLPWSAGKYIDTRKYYPQDRVYCDGSIYASLAEQVGNKPYFKQDSDGTYTVAQGWALLAAGLLEDNGLGYDYEVLENLPSVNGVVLKGDKTPEELGMYSKEEADGKFETKSHAADTFQTKESAAEYVDVKNLTVAEAIVSLAARLDALEGSRGLLGDATAGTVDVRGLTRCRYPLVMLGHGVPAEANVPVNLPDGLPWDGVPAFAGQQYVNLDAASGGLYYAAGVNSVADWKQA